MTDIKFILNCIKQHVFMAPFHVFIFSYAYEKFIYMKFLIHIRELKYKFVTLTMYL